MISNKKSIELVISFENQSKLIFFEEGTTMEDFKTEIRKHFNLGVREIKLIAINKNAEIISTKSFQSDLQIEIKVEKAVQNKDRTDNSPKHKDLTEIDYNEIINEKFTGDELLSAINLWTKKFKFSLVFGQGKQKIKEGWKRILSCQKKKCSYRLIFLSSENEKDYKICEKLSSQYKIHSKTLSSIF